MKKGFTLIELLAVLVILAVIALIATPIVLNIINDTKKSAVVRSAEFYMDGLKLSISQTMLKNKKVEDGIYSIMEDGNICIGILNDNTCTGDILKVEVKGENPTSGIIRIRDGKISNITGLQLGEIPISMVDDKLIASKIYEATPENLASIISKAEAGATIKLTPGNYAKIELNKYDAYKEGLTILGQEGVNVAGLFISSERPYNPNDENPNDEKLILPGGLTFKNINFTENFLIRNGKINNVSVIECTFAEGVKLSFYSTLIEPGAYRNDGFHATDVVISDCIFENASCVETFGSKCSAISLRPINGALVQNNTINGAAFNGIQVLGSHNKIPSTGRIVISNNKISNTGSRSIRIDSIKNADLIVRDNQLSNSDLDETNTEYIKFSTYSNTNVKWINNTYDGRVITVGEGKDFGIQQIN